MALPFPRPSGSPEGWWSLGPALILVETTMSKKVKAKTKTKAKVKAIPDGYYTA